MMNVYLSIFTKLESLTVPPVWHTVLRICLPILAIVIVFRSARSLLGFRREPEVWAWLRLGADQLIPVTHWENVLGRKRTADIVLDFATVSKNHAVLTRRDDGGWTITDIGAKGRVEVNGNRVLNGSVCYGDVINLGGLEMRLEPVSKEEARLQSGARTKAGKGHSPGLTLVLLTLLQALLVFSFVINDAGPLARIFTSFAILAGVEWAFFIAQKLIRRSGFEVETIAFFLMSFGLAVAASSDPANLYKQLVSMGLGMVIFLIVGLCLRDLETAAKLRRVAAIAGVVLLAANLALGSRVNGSQNWIYLGGFSFQPSELVKVCFVLAGASTMDRIVTRRNLLLFVLYTAFIGACLVVMNDFGTATIFFLGFLAIALLRSSSYPSVALILAGVGMAAVMVVTVILAVKYFPYVRNRFAGYGHIWAYMNDKGYQQANSLICIASGGLFGLGAGCGWLKNVAAADTDLVFAFVCEEWGLLMAGTMIIALGALGLFVVRSAKVARSSFYTIGATAAISILLGQAILNFFGTVDFLPLTGVTFPFVSSGGSSMMCCWGLLAFIKACDTRQNASFAVKLSQKEAEKA